jgi:hypothetical protein
MAESFVSRLKREELIHRHYSWPNRQTEGEEGDLRVHRGLLQHQKEAFSTRAPQPFRVRRG